MARSTVEIDSDVFIDLLWDRVDEFPSARGYSKKFWEQCFEYLEEVGFMGDPQYNSPSYIIDNIAINGEILDFDECKDNFDEIESDYDGDVEEWANDEGYLIFDDMVVINLGL